MGPKKNPPRSKMDGQEGTAKADRSKAENTPRRSTRSAAQIATARISSRNKETVARSIPEATSLHSGEKAAVPLRSNENASKEEPSKSVADAEHLIKPNDSETNRNLGEIQAQTDRNGVHNGQYPTPECTAPDLDIGLGYVSTLVHPYMHRSALDLLREYAPAPTIENVISPIDSPEKESSSPIGPLLLPSTDEDIEESVESILKLEHSPDSAYDENSETLTLSNDQVSAVDPSSDESMSCSRVNGRTNASTQCDLPVVQTADASTCTLEDKLLDCSSGSDPSLSGYISEIDSNDTSEKESRRNECCHETERSSSSDEDSGKNGSESENENGSTSQSSSEGNEPEGNPVRDRLGSRKC